MYVVSIRKTLAGNKRNDIINDLFEVFFLAMPQRNVFILKESVKKKTHLSYPMVNLKYLMYFQMRLSYLMVSKTFL